MESHARGRLTLVAAVCVVVFGAQSLGAQGFPVPPPPPPPPFGQPATETEPVKGTGLVAGQVVDASTSKPVARVVVSILGAQAPTFVNGVMVDAPGVSNSPRQVLTDASGRFLFRELAKGRYTIRATAPGYVTGAFGQSKPNGPSQTVELDENDSKVGNLAVRVWKTATLTGTITDEAGEPVIGVGVSGLRRTFVNGQPRMASSINASTDDRGFYRLTNLVPGEYTVAVMSSQSTTPVSTIDAYRDVAMSGAGMTNSDLYRELSSSGASMAMSMGFGGFRVGDLMLSPGAVGRNGLIYPAPIDNQRLLIYPTTYYPSAMTFTQATVVKLESGDTRSNIDMQLKLTPSLRVSGMVMGPDGPAKNTAVRLYPAGNEAFAGSFLTTEAASSVTDAAGAFTFLGVTPGQYTLKVTRVPRPITLTNAPSNSTTIEVAGPGGMMMMGMVMSGPSMAPPPPLPAEPSVWATQQVIVGDEDLNGVSVTLRPGARLSGRIQFEGARTPPTPEQLQRTNVVLTSNEPRQLMVPTPMSRVEADGRFNTMGYAPGRYQVQANVPSTPTLSGPVGPSGWLFKSATVNGRDLADDPLEIGSEDVAGIVITFTDRQTTLGGTVLDARGQPDKTAEIVMFPADSQGWRQGIPTPRRVRTGRASLTGKYEFGNVPAGDYYAVAVAGGSSGDIQDPKFLETLIPVATRVTVADGDRRTQDLTSKQIK